MNPHSETIASFIGPTALAMAGFLLLNHNDMPLLMTDMAGQWPVMFLSGLTLLVAGLAIVRVHNVWERGWRVIVTLIGWLAVAGGFARILYPRQLAAFAPQAADQPVLILVGGVVLLLLGAFLTFKGYRLLD